MAKISTAPAWQVAIVILTGTVVGSVVLAVLYLAQSICIPFAMAAFFAFLLGPMVTLLRRTGIGRTISVLLVVSGMMLLLAGIFWIVGTQARSLVAEAPAYSENVRAKVKALRQMTHLSGIRVVEHMIREVSGEADRPAEDAKRPTEVVAKPEIPPWLTSVSALVGRLAEMLGGLMLALVLLVFMLLNREDLRNRLIRLVGDGRLTATTKAFDDVSQRVRRYLLLQLIVNGTFGLTISLGLWAIGVRYAFLCGFLAFLLRYLPYIGPWIAALPPTLLCLAMFEGWTQPLLVIGLFTIVELVAGNVVEPRLYGHGIGVSEVALLVAAAFWAFLWGPAGLILSSPLTVCLVVMGKYVPHLKFLDVLLSDEPVLAPEVTYYQRLLARDQDEAAELVLAQFNSSSAPAVYDELLVPALNFTKRDIEQDELTDSDVRFVLDSTVEILEDLGERNGVGGANVSDTSSAHEATDSLQRAKVHVLACPAFDRFDSLGVEMLRQLLDPLQWDVEVVSIETITSKLESRLAARTPLVVCIAALPPGGLAHTRYLCKRLRQRFPSVTIIIGRWGMKDNLHSNSEQLQKAGASVTTATLRETVEQLKIAAVEVIDEGSQTERSLAALNDSPTALKSDRATLVGVGEPKSLNGKF